MCLIRVVRARAYRSDNRTSSVVVERCRVSGGDWSESKKTKYTHELIFISANMSTAVHARVNVFLYSAVVLQLKTPHSR